MQSNIIFKQKCVTRDFSNYSLMGIFQSFEDHKPHLEGLKVPWMDFRASNNIRVDKPKSLKLFHGRRHMRYDFFSLLPFSWLIKVAQTNLNFPRTPRFTQITTLKIQTTCCLLLSLRPLFLWFGQRTRWKHCVPSPNHYDTPPPLFLTALQRNLAFWRAFG